jgi:hypothetical protein
MTDLEFLARRHAAISAMPNSTPKKVSEEVDDDEAYDQDDDYSEPQEVRQKVNKATNFDIPDADEIFKKFHINPVSEPIKEPIAIEEQPREQEESETKNNVASNNKKPVRKRKPRTIHARKLPSAKSTGIWLPKVAYKNMTFTSTDEVILYLKVNMLDNDDRENGISGCDATNEHFALLLGCSAQRRPA